MLKILREGFQKSPWWLRAICPNARFLARPAGNEVYLTFDDGPTPGVTDTILDLLHQHDCQATFFCIGEKLEAHPEIIDKALRNGHTVGNHTYSHANAWNQTRDEYMRDLNRCQALIDGLTTRQFAGFRPPFGRLRLGQAAQISKLFPVYLWDVTSQDFLPTRSSQNVAEIVMRNTEAGSIVLMHDSLLTGARVIEALPLILEGLQKRGFKTRPLPAVA
jgi:peptidoglycan-N-acetylglucosamine deacetylase